MQQITIVGLGFVGGSLGMALRAAYNGKVEVIGYDANQKVHNAAKKLGSADRTEWNLDDAVRGSDLVIVAVPASSVQDVFEAVAPHLKPGVVVTDTTATKRMVQIWADELLPPEVSFVGGNPIVGMGLSGSASASPAIFQGAKYCIVAAPRAPQEAVASVVSLAEAIGAKPMFIDKDEHDSFIAAMNGLPTLVSAALMLTAAKSPSWREISQFSKGQFNEVTKLASADPSVTRGLFDTNSDMMVHWVDEMIAQLTQLKMLAADPTNSEASGPLLNALVAAWEARARMEAGVNQSETLRDTLPTASEGMMTMFMGSMGAKLFRADKKRDPNTYDRNKLN